MPAAVAVLAMAAPAAAAADPMFARAPHFRGEHRRDDTPAGRAVHAGCSSFAPSTRAGARSPPARSSGCWSAGRPSTRSGCSASAGPCAAATPGLRRSGSSRDRRGEGARPGRYEDRHLPRPRPCHLGPSQLPARDRRREPQAGRRAALVVRSERRRRRRPRSPRHRGRARAGAGRVVDTIGWFSFNGVLHRTYRWSPTLRGQQALLQASVVGPGGTRTVGYIVHVR